MLSTRIPFNTEEELRVYFMMMILITYIAPIGSVHFVRVPRKEARLHHTPNSVDCTV